MKKIPHQKSDNTFYSINQALQLIWIHLKENILKLCRASVNQPSYSLRQILLSGVGSFLGIAVLVYLTLHTKYPLIAAPFGASAVLLYAVPESPLAQPRNVIGGNIIGAVTCITLVHLFGDAPWVQAASVAIAIKLMQLTKTLHPPGGAVALVGAMSNASWGFLFTPVLAGSIIILICTYTFNKFVATRAYPVHWI